MKALSELPYIEWTEPDSGEVERLYADVITSESANLAAVVTKHAVEKGAAITDHYRKDNETVSIEMFFSGSPIRGDLDPNNPGSVQSRPLNYPPNQASGAPIFTPGGLTQAVGSAIGGALGFGPPALPSDMNVLVFDSPPSKRLQTVVEKIRNLQARGLLVTVKTTFGPFENVGITNAQPSRKPEDGDGGRIQFELEQMNFVTSDVVTAIPLPEEPRALPKKTNSASGTSATEGSQSSALKAITDSIGLTTPGSGV
jgi:hypothetical protein